MDVTLATAEHDRRTAYLRSRLATDGWSLRDEQLDSLVGVLPSTGGPDAAVVADTEAAFIVGETLVVATWDKDFSRVNTSILSLAGAPLTVEWDAEWLAGFGAESGEVPDGRPIIITVQAPNGEASVLPFEGAWQNPLGCVGFASTLIARAHGFRPGVDTEFQGLEQRTWKR